MLLIFFITYTLLVTVEVQVQVREGRVLMHFGDI